MGVLPYVKGMEAYVEHLVTLENKLTVRIAELELKHRNLWKRIGELSAECENRRPWKCPVCQGKGKIYIDPSKPMSGIEAAFAPRDINGMHYNECHACERGVLWK